ncbi:MAG: exodeoxyribonuclease III [Saprospiraceae bacterium]|nr:exodeoxyribonuclease III [Saprospiraceae bacterium]
MKILSYNTNGIRAALKKDLAAFLATDNFDIVCIQETKASPDQVDTEGLTQLGFVHQYWVSAEKKGYSGVAIFSKIQPDNVVEGMGISRYDSEGRVIRADFGDWTLLNVYFPSGTSGDERQAVKMDFLADMYDWIAELKKERPHIILVGDYNIAHTELDIHNPKGNVKTSGFLPEERAWMTKWFESGFVDAFRFKNPTLQEYSWWSTRFNSRASNKGWRIDYQSVTDSLKDKIVSCRQLNDAVHSDHCPVLLEINL